MYAIEEKRRVLEDGTEIVTYSRDIYNANVIRSGSWHNRL